MLKILNVLLHILFKMMSHCANERRVRKRDKKVRRDVI